MKRKPATTAKERHLAKLAQAFFENLEYNENGYGSGLVGYVGLDFKRPFGNQDVAEDVLEIIGAKMEGDDGEDACYSSTQREYAVELLKALPGFLQRVFAKGKHARTWQTIVGQTCPKCAER